MSNFWIKKDEMRKLHASLDSKAMDCWSKDETFGDFIKSLTKDELDFLHKFRIKDFSGDLNIPSIGIELVSD
jgi:hypothetical protein